ncbi:MAG: TetR/AcrR family transcriptional regulator [Candidatus Limnocylindria bacterium]
MTRLDNPSARRYHSELRAQQADETRARILDATLRVMARGIATLSVPDVAREAGVSVPTVYRHFRTKLDLLAAVYPHVVRRHGLKEFVPPRSLDELRDGVRTIFGQVDSFDDLERAAMASPASDEVRKLSVPRRLAAIRQLVEAIDPNLVERDRDRITRLLAVLVTSSSLRVWRDQLGASVDQAADDIDWAVRAAVAAAAKEE